LRLKRIYLPPQTPSLNPIQYLFIHLKRSLLSRKNVILSEQDLALSLEKAMDELNHASTEYFFEEMYKAFQRRKLEVDTFCGTEKVLASLSGSDFD
jgi:hypothetical protein